MWNCRPNPLASTSACRAVQFYRSSAPLPASARDHILASAHNLDVLLLRNGWTIDRPQDPITTIAGSILTKPVAPFTSTQVVPYHENIGGISCNLIIQFSGPNDGVSPGIVSVNEFSCQQAVSIVIPHIFTHAADPGYGGGMRAWANTAGSVPNCRPCQASWS
jgi:hypothetical protein